MSAPREPILPGAMLGVLGGGQLGRMWAQAAQAHGYAVAVLDSDANSPAGAISQQHIRAAYDDTQALAQLARMCAAVTVEFENIPTAALDWLAQRLPLAPASAAVAVAQDRAREKVCFAACGVPCAPWAAIETAAHVATVDGALLPGILKTARLGYDGKGQVPVHNAAQLAAAWEQLGRVPCVLEKMLDLAWECSVIIARGYDSSMVHLPVQRNRHRAGILACTEVFPGQIPESQAAQALVAARALAQQLDYVGVLCVEFFVLHDGTLLANEMAPRPHNSGHYSQNACDISQFELQLRCMARLPLQQPRQHSPALMLNLLGDLWFDAQERLRQPAWHQILALPGAHLHLYGKHAARRGRKMGHLNITAVSMEAVRACAAQAATILGLPESSA